MRNIKQTELWEVMPNGKRFRMNVISGGSRFNSFPVPANLSTPEAQLQVARTLKDGWILCGNKPLAKYEIVQEFVEGGRTERITVH